MRLVSIELLWQAQCFFIDQFDALYQVKAEVTIPLPASKPSNIEDMVCPVTLFLGVIKALPRLEGSRDNGYFLLKYWQ